MATSKSATPAVQDHPALDLRIGKPDERSALSKVYPLSLPNDDLVEHLQQTYPKDKRWREFRNDYRYIYVVDWMYQCRGYLKLANDHFDVDSFEIELFNLVNPPPLDDLSLILHKARLALISKVHGKKAESLALFEPLYRVYFGTDLPLGGTENSEEVDVSDGAELTVKQAEDLPTFDDLYIDEKIDILYDLMYEVSLYADFRDYVEKHIPHPDFARPLLLFRGKDPKRPAVLEDYILVFDGTAMYKRTVVVPPMEIPKKRLMSPQNPQEDFGEEAFDAKKITYELVYKDIFTLDTLIQELLVHRNYKKNRLLLEVIKKPAAISNFFFYETEKRRIIMSRKKENEMAHLLATRKKSSRLEAKKKQRHEEEQEKKLQELEELKYATTRRSQRNYNYLENKIKSDFTAGLTREERAKLRKGPAPDPVEFTNGMHYVAKLLLEEEENNHSHEDSAMEEDIVEDPEPKIDADTPLVKDESNIPAITEVPEISPEMHISTEGHSDDGAIGST